MPRREVAEVAALLAEPGSFEYSFARSANFAGLAFAFAYTSSASFFAAAFSSSLASGFTGIRMCAAARSSSAVYWRELASYCFFTSAGSTVACADQRFRVSSTNSMRACSGVWKAVGFLS